MFPLNVIPENKIEVGLAETIRWMAPPLPAVAWHPVKEQPVIVKEEDPPTVR